MRASVMSEGKGLPGTLPWLRGLAGCQAQGRRCHGCLGTSNVSSAGRIRPGCNLYFQSSKCREQREDSGYWDGSGGGAGSAGFVPGEGQVNQALRGEESHPSQAFCARPQPLSHPHPALILKIPQGIERSSLLLAWNFSSGCCFVAKGSSCCGHTVRISWQLFLH